LCSEHLGFTPQELKIANLIKDGNQDKDISEILNISLETVKTHRQNIRKKLNIRGKKTNLTTYLLSFTE
jgi:DNA-binding CsgD family transcriptional regulator